MWCSDCKNCMASGEVDNAQTMPKNRRVVDLGSEDDSLVLQEMLR